jgi:hypothetical protein
LKQQLWDVWNEQMISSHENLPELEKEKKICQRKNFLQGNFLIQVIDYPKQHFVWELGNGDLENQYKFMGKMTPPMNKATLITNECSEISWVIFLFAKKENTELLRIDLRFPEEVMSTAYLPFTAISPLSFYGNYLAGRTPQDLEHVYLWDVITGDEILRLNFSVMIFTKYFVIEIS